MTVPVSHRESDDTYHGIVARLNDRWRVIVCRDGIQWILQRKNGQTSTGARWAGDSYFRTRQALIRVCRTRTGEIDPFAASILAALSDRIEETSNRNSK